MMQQVVSSVWRLGNSVSNWYVVEAGGKFTVVDAGKPSDWKQLVDALAQMSSNIGAIECVLLTHAHSDHTGFAERARAAVHATARVHSADAAVAKGGKQPKTDGRMFKYLVHAEAYRTLFGLMRGGGLRIVPLAEVTTFEDGEVLDVPGRPRAVHVPGHTSGSSAFWFEQHSVLCTGDALVTRNVMIGRRGPQIMPSAMNQRSDDALASLTNLEKTAAQTVLPGHGDPWLQGIASAVHAARRAGKS